MYSAMTRAIRIEVEPCYLDDQSQPDQYYYVWSYHVKIHNSGNESVQLKHRYWRITDAFGRMHEIRGMGVIGQQPTIEPGACFEYTSGTPLSTPSGIMLGNYEMTTPEGETFEVDIPPFPLDCPHVQHMIH